MAEFTDEMKAALFASWSAQVGETIPDIVMDSFMSSHPQSMNPNPVNEYDEKGEIIYTSPGHPVVWAKDEQGYKASIEGMLRSTDVITISPTGIRIREVRQMAQIYLPERIKNCILAMFPTWNSGAIYSTPVTRVTRITDNGGDPLARYWDAKYIENWEISFDDPSITTERILALPEYQAVNTITFDKYSKIL